MNHILPHIDPAKEWIVFGKGPSFDPSVVNRFPEAKTICINNTANFVAADICIMCDFPAVMNLNEFAFANTKMFALPASVNRGIAGGGPDTAIFWIDGAHLFQKMSGRTNYFDINLSFNKYFPAALTAHIHVSTFEAVVWLFAFAGVKKFYTSGVDHSVSYNNKFAERPESVPYSAVPYYTKMVTDTLGIEVVAL